MSEHSFDTEQNSHHVGDCLESTKEVIRLCRRSYADNKVKLSVNTVKLTCEAASLPASQYWHVLEALKSIMEVDRTMRVNMGLGKEIRLASNESRVQFVEVRTLLLFSSLSTEVRVSVSLFVCCRKSVSNCWTLAVGFFSISIFNN